MKARPTRQRRTRANNERWLVSYADFITLLFAFFVVLYASSQTDQKRAAKISSAIEQAFEQLGLGTSNPPGNTSRVAPITPEIRASSSLADRSHETLDIGSQRRVTAAQVQTLRGELQAAIPEELTRSDVTLRTTSDGLVISLQEIGFFDSGSAKLRPSSISAFGRIASILREKQCTVRVEGHTDPMPIHTAQYASNWELSTARATGIVKRLIQEYGINPGDLSAGGYAEFHPVGPNDTAEGRAQNRRVDLVILSMQGYRDQRK
ncbi:outer membrane protein, OmpA/MotB family [Candidatus Koribacter versatilis Ellin345]|uniref:Outer membrane protein, OmpA/MotB family n=1 Tax=Koribacter versatilis (strain Ellin345) TaxID=204669 RepID=Q1IMG7_KORVE|nr:flagellar motor protein MotB [Candidatus Koribacter versatilis]ABF41933.1 outer membrane protein, OmpA/MotB family [Candidatus Koribacter versatilis Ellin345]